MVWKEKGRAPVPGLRISDWLRGLDLNQRSRVAGLCARLRGPLAKS
jgi:hypothetical protein